MNQISSSPTLPRPEIVVFDLDNTLYPYQSCHAPALSAVLEELALTFNMSRDAAEKAYGEARSIIKNQLGESASSHSRLLYLFKTFEVLGFGPRPREALNLEQLYWRSYLAEMELTEGVSELFSTIKIAKIPMALVTDLTAAIQFRKLEVLGLSETFDYIVTSEECSGEKNSGASYALLLEKLGREYGEHLWMVGDSEADMMAKQHIGATTICASFFERNPAKRSADATVTSVAQLSTLVVSSCHANP